MRVSSLEEYSSRTGQPNRRERWLGRESTLKVLDCDAIGWTKIDPVRVELDDLSALKHEPVSHGGKNFAADSGNAFRGLEVGEMAERECQIAAQAVDQNLEGALKSGESAAFERVGCQFGGALCAETVGA